MWRIQLWVWMLRGKPGGDFQVLMKPEWEGEGERGGEGRGEKVDLGDNTWARCSLNVTLVQNYNSPGNDPIMFSITITFLSSCYSLVIQRTLNISLPKYNCIHSLLGNTEGNCLPSFSWYPGESFTNINLWMSCAESTFNQSIQVNVLY